MAGCGPAYESDIVSLNKVSAATFEPISRIRLLAT
jgi:hypothetical protein